MIAIWMVIYLNLLSFSDIIMMDYQNMVRFHSIFLHFSKVLEWDASFKSKTNDTSHLELPNNENASVNKG